MQNAHKQQHSNTDGRTNGANKVLQFPSADKTSELRSPPHNLEAEQAVLGAILINNSAYGTVAGMLESAHFYDPLHAQIYETAAVLIGQGKNADPLTLKPFFENHGPVDAMTTVVQYLGRLAANVPSIANVRDYAQTICDLSTCRQMVLIGEDVARAAHDVNAEFPPEEQLAELRARVDSMQGVGIAENSSWMQPDFSLTEDRRGELPEFPVEALSYQFGDWLVGAARGAGVTPAHVVVPLLSIASSIIGAARQVRAAPAWSEPCTLWTGIVGFSGTGKTPGINVTKRALAAIQRQRKEMYAERRRKHDDRVAASQAALKKWQSDVNKATDAGEAVPSKPRDADAPGPFVEPRLYVADTTTERLAVLLQERPTGIALVRDELAGLFSNMGRYSKGSDKEFWLESWNGGQHSVERQGRAPVDVDHLLVGITGGFQPDTLVKSFSGDDDGMYARFLFSWPSAPNYQPLSMSVLDVEPAFHLALTRLIDLSAAGDDGVPKLSHIDLAPEARARFDCFRQDVHTGMCSLDGRGREWWCKGPTNVLRLAGTLTYLDWAFSVGPSFEGSANVCPPVNEPTSISAEYIERAASLWADYFWSHACSVLRQGGPADARHRDSRTVLRWLQAHAKQETSVEELRRLALSQRLNEKETRSLLDKLIQSGWLRPLPVRKQRGKPKRRWEVNPVLAQIAQIA